MKRLHIVGCPRSGTTLLATMVTTCFEYAGVYQREESIFRNPPGQMDLYISKKPSDIKYIHNIFFNDPSLFVLYIVRDPRSVMTSTHYSNRDQYFCNYLTWERVDKAALKYSGHERFLSVRYEDLVQNPDKVQQQIKQAFPFLKQKIAFSEYQDHAKPSENTTGALNGLRAADAKRIEGWKKHLPRIKEQLQRRPQMQLALMSHGYETDDAWTSMLNEVEAKVFPCREDEKSHPIKSLEKKLRHWWRSKRYIRHMRKRFPQ